MIDYKSLRPGNWIYPTGRSKYVVVTGLLLGMMEKNEDLCKEFEGIELTGELLEAAGASTVAEFADIYRIGNFDFERCHGYWEWCVDDRGDNEGSKVRMIQYLHQVQNIYHSIMGHELPLPESAKIIPQTTP